MLLRMECFPFKYYNHFIITFMFWKTYIYVFVSQPFLRKSDAKGTKALLPFITTISLISLLLFCYNDRAGKIFGTNVINVKKTDDKEVFVKAFSSIQIVTCYAKKWNAMKNTGFSTMSSFQKTLFHDNFFFIDYWPSTLLIIIYKIFPEFFYFLWYSINPIMISNMKMSSMSKTLISLSFWKIFCIDAWWS